jgi:hypothetical protein
LPLAVLLPAWVGSGDLYAQGKTLTILRAPSSTRESGTTDPQAIALGALAWLLQSESRADRLLALTGLTPDALRSGIGDSAVLSAVLDFLAANEPDLVGAAETLGVSPDVLVRAAAELQR